ncbi:MAG: hypothetical protein RMM98_04420, partial [Acidobacteriota bacterium]|nr:hypothetical protein [Acidobacteriota bacterium]
VRRPRVVELPSLLDTLERHLSKDEIYDLLLLDLLLCGPAQEQPEGPELWLAVEISTTVDVNDVERARRRAELLRKAGYRAIPVVAGETTTEGAEDAARRQMIPWLQDGKVFFWEEGVHAWTTL